MVPLNLEGYHEALDVSGEITETSLEYMESRALEPQLMALPETGEVLVYGNPFELAKDLDSNQGDNIYNFGGDCGLVSVLNLLRMNGMDFTEDEVVGRAIDLNLCHSSIFSPSSQNGGTTVMQRQALLNTYGISSAFYSSSEAGGTLDAIADYVEAGHGVNISVNAGYAWNDVNCIDDGSSNHSIIVTGTVRDVTSGELKGLVVCDSGAPSPNSGSMYLSKEVLQDAYVNAPGTTAIVTAVPLR